MRVQNLIQHFVFYWQQQLILPSHKWCFRLVVLKMILQNLENESYAVSCYHWLEVIS